MLDVRTMWVRVPVYIGMLDEIQTDGAIRIVGLDGKVAEFTRPAKPIAAPPTADPLSTTADLYFEADNADVTLKPGQRVGAEVSLRGDGEGLVVPSDAIVYDIQGGTWVYVSLGENVFERRRVSVRFVKDSTAVLAEGPPAGTPVVIDGTAELYGTEFGAGK